MTSSDWTKELVCISMRMIQEVLLSTANWAYLQLGHVACSSLRRESARRWMKQPAHIRCPLVHCGGEKGEVTATQNVRGKWRKSLQWQKRQKILALVQAGKLKVNFSCWMLWQKCDYNLLQLWFLLGTAWKNLETILGFYFILKSTQFGGNVIRHVWLRLGVFPLSILIQFKLK